MRSLIRLLCILLPLATLLCGGCVTTQRTTTRHELRDLLGKGPLRALTVDTLLYTFETFSFTDSLLSGRGDVKRDGRTEPFEGSVPFRRIVFLERREASFGKVIWMVPMLVYIGAGTVSMLTESEKFEIYRPMGGSSCPAISSFDGTGYTLEAEAFGTSISRALEGRTFSVLPSLVPAGDTLKVRISNDRPETHLLNSVQLYAGDAGGEGSAVLDTRDTLWPVASAVVPARATDHSGRDILPDISEADGKFWRSDLAQTTPLTGYRDQIDIEFDLPAGTREARLIVRSINSELITEVYRSAGGLLGDQTLEFYNSLEKDPELQSAVREWIEEAGLRVEIPDGEGSVEGGIILPEATAVPFTRAVRIRGLGGVGGTLHARLSSMTDVWHIDAVTLDCSPAKPIILHSLEMLSVTSSATQEARAAIAADDSSYAIILPPEKLEVSFDASPARGMRHPVYVVAAKGYLYEWFPPTQEPPPPGLPASSLPSDRVALFKILVRQRDLFLPSLYAIWKARAQGAGDHRAQVPK